MAQTLIGRFARHLSPAWRKALGRVYYATRDRVGRLRDRSRQRLRAYVFYTRKSRYGVETVRNYWIDRRYGGWCGGRISSSFRAIGAYAVQSVDYYALRAIFAPRGGVTVAPEDVLVDVGCGKGRVLNYWLDQGLGREIIGLELESEIAARTAQRLARFPHASIRPGNALETLPEHGTLFFLFNPFGPQVLEPLKQRLREIASRHPLRVLYYYPKHVEVFRGDPEWHVETLANHPWYEGVVITYRGPTTEAQGAA